MTKILGIDPASTIGWALLEDKKLIDFGSILCASSLDIKEKMLFYKNSITKLLEKTQPDYVFIEDVILCISGVKTLVYLTRINSSIIFALMEKLKSDEIFLVEPSKWKSNCFLNINSRSKKYHTMIEICKYFNLIDDDLIDEFQKKHLNIINIENEIEAINLNIKNHNIIITKCTNAINRKKQNVLKDEEKKQCYDNINKSKIKISELKQLKKEKIKKAEKEGREIIKFILYTTNITEDIADSIAIALYGFNLLKNKEIKGV